MENFKIIKGDRIESLRLNHKPKKVTRRALADIVGRDEVTVWRWESGQNNPSDEDLAKIAAFFGVPLSYFYPESDEKFMSRNSLISALSEQEQEISRLKMNNNKLSAELSELKSQLNRPKVSALFEVVRKLEDDLLDAILEAARGYLKDSQSTAYEKPLKKKAPRK